MGLRVESYPFVALCIFLEGLLASGCASAGKGHCLAHVERLPEFANTLVVALDRLVALAEARLAAQQVPMRLQGSGIDTEANASQLPGQRRRSSAAEEDVDDEESQDDDTSSDATIGEDAPSDSGETLDGIAMAASGAGPVTQCLAALEREAEVADCGDALADFHSWQEGRAAAVAYCNARLPETAALRGFRPLKEAERLQADAHLHKAERLHHNVGPAVLVMRLGKLLETLHGAAQTSGLLLLEDHQFQPASSVQLQSLAATARPMPGQDAGEEIDAAVVEGSLDAVVADEAEEPDHVSAVMSMLSLVGETELSMDDETGLCVPQREVEAASSSSAEAATHSLRVERDRLQQALKQQQEKEAAVRAAAARALSRAKGAQRPPMVVQPTVVVVDTNCFLEEQGLQQLEAMTGHSHQRLAVPLVGMSHNAGAEWEDGRAGCRQADRQAEGSEWPGAHFGKGIGVCSSGSHSCG